MPDVVLAGVDFSPYVRTARMALHEKGVPYRTTVDDIAEVRANKLAAHHPFSRMPALRHGDVHVFETLGIVSYIDDTFDGPRLIPAEPLPRAQVLQWISAYNDYLFRDMIRNYAVIYTFSPEEDWDRAALADAADAIDGHLAMLDGVYGDRDWLVGDHMTAADLFLTPTLSALRRFPETAEMLPRYPNVGRALAAMARRDSFAVTTPGAAA